MREMFRNLMIEELKDLYDAEHQIVEALPKMIDAATHSDLKSTFQNHLEQTRGHIQRLEQVFQRLGATPERKTCKGVRGIVQEAEELIKKCQDRDVLDAGLIGEAQKVEHYEIAGYGTVRTWANMLGMSDVCQTLQQTLEEEGDADHKLTAIAERHINLEALQRAA